MKKISILLIFVLVVTMFAGCTTQPSDNDSAPTVVGVKDVQCLVNSTVDFLDGVAALDVEDGDITPNMSITVYPHVDVNDGYATFTEVGSYTVNFEVTDSSGNKSAKRSYVEVLDRETYHSFAMPDGYTVEAYGAAKVTKQGMYNSAFVVQAEGGEIAEDVQIVRTFTVSADDFIKREYTFTTKLNSQTAGKITVFCNGEPTAEAAVQEGDNDVKFTCACDNNSATTCDIKVVLCVGALGNVDLIVGDTTVTYPQNEGAEVDRTKDFTFKDNVEPRIDSNPGADQVGQFPSGTTGLEGNAWPMPGNAAARLEITHPSNDNAIWRGGMFLKTGVTLKEGTTYVVSFNVERHFFTPGKEVNEEDDNNNPANYEILLQNTQWTDKNLDKIISPENGKIERTITVPNGFAGTLVIYVQSGSQTNQITVSELSVIEKLGATGSDNFAVTDFTYFNATAGAEFNSELGHVTYKVQSFNEKDSDHVVTSPNFYVSGSGANYVVQFKIKATAPIAFAVAGPVAEGWDPTLLYQRLSIGANEEYTFAFACSGGSAADRWHKIVWQFGFSANTQYHDVTIEIYDIRICRRDAVLDA